mgnify:CR=1 FL=1
MLAAAGFPRLRLIDPDVVEDINLGTQMWPERFLGAPKVLAAADLCRELCQETVVETAVRHFGREDMPKTRDSVVFCCVDSFTARRQIFAICQKLVGFFVDGRMGAEVFHTYAFVPRAGEGRSLPRHPDRGRSRRALYGPIDRLYRRGGRGDDGRATDPVAPGPGHVRRIYP